ncbi:MAG TPA: glycosyltransferase family 1 protein [Thermoanaerobaculia bacterium]|nr:glycosyltransferase family 1 protein [Thermoanaerobaculia bacterium]
MVLHYVNYGYARRGCPWWLVRGLRRWRREAGRQLVTIFHEVRATGLPWQSSFWLSGMQLHLARQVARSSDHALTSMERYADLLAAGRGVRRPVVLPVFSAIGEPREVPPLPDRDRRIVVFGGRDVRSRAYRRSLAELASACRTIGAREVLDVGAGDASPPAEVAGRPIKLLGECPDDEVSDLLRSSYAGFLSYPPEFLPKSTIFAAYCAHGTLPICAPMGATVAPEAPPFARAASSADGHQELVVRCLRWYRGHSLSEHSRLLRQWVQDR